jgi:hypothetical protein
MNAGARALTWIPKRVGKDYAFFSIVPVTANFLEVRVATVELQLAYIWKINLFSNDIEHATHKH